MAFNWFRRQYEQTQPTDESDQLESGKLESDHVESAKLEAAKAQTESSSQQSSQVSVSDAVGDTVKDAVKDAVETARSTPPSTVNYMGWAKAAFQNIQQQIHENVHGTDAQPIPPTGAIALNTEIIKASEGTGSQSEVPTADPDPLTESVPGTRPEEICQTIDETSSIAQTVLGTLPEATTSSGAGTSLSDSPSNLESENQSGEEGDGSGESPLSSLTFDEDFLWSAEVLAAQGRQPDDVSSEEITWLQKLRRGLDKTRRGLVNQIKTAIGQGPLSASAIADIEDLLLQADVGIEATDRVVAALQKRMLADTLAPEQALPFLKQILQDILDRPLGDRHSPSFVPEKGHLNIWLITGVNGAGKTTTIGKIAHLARKSGYHCLIAAADTFRAAAVEQVKAWGARSQVDVIANPTPNADPAAVVFDAIAAAQARGVELLLVDTAGRLQNKKNLMEELGKIRRIIDKKAEGAKVESLLVLDATLGQNGLRQAEVFSSVAHLNGVVLTKLDGTAKGGVALAVVQELNLPIRFLGVGEGIEDLRPFSSYEFVEALLNG